MSDQHQQTYTEHAQQHWEQVIDFMKSVKSEGTHNDN